MRASTKLAQKQTKVTFNFILNLPLGTKIKLCEIKKNRWCFWDLFQKMNKGYLPINF